MKVREKEENKEISKEKVERKSSKKENLIFVSCSIGIIAVLLLVSTIITNSRIDDTYKMAEKIYNNLKKDYSNITLIEEEKKEDKYSYVSSTLIYIDSIRNKEDKNFAVSVAKYNSNAEALKEEEFINEYNKLAHKKFDNTVAQLVEDYDSIFMNNVTLVKGKYLFSINPKVRNQKKLINNIEKIVKNYDISDISKVDKNTLDKYWKNRNLNLC